MSDLGYSISKKKIYEETFYEWKHCTQDSENLIVKLKQEIIKLQKINKGKNILIDNLSFKVSDLDAEYKKKGIDEETLSCTRCSQKNQVSIF